MDAVLQWVSTYGYAAIFGLLVLGIVGVPVPDEVLLVFSGYLAFSGRLNPAGTLLAAAAGSISGITCSYLLGRTFGLPLLHSKLGRYTHISDRDIQRVHNWFHRAGHWALFIGYYIPGVRHFTAVVAGTSRVEFRIFALYAYSGAAVWVAIFFTIGYHFGERWRIVFDALEQNVRLVLVAGAAALVLYLLVQYVWNRLQKTRR